MKGLILFSFCPLKSNFLLFVMARYKDFLHTFVKQPINIECAWTQTVMILASIVHTFIFFTDTDSTDGSTSAASVVNFLDLEKRLLDLGNIWFDFYVFFGVL